MGLQPQQFGQLKMFMTGPEIKAQYAAGDAIGTGGSQEQTWKSKAAEVNRGWDYADDTEGPNYGWRNLGDEIGREGVKTPVHILHGYQNRVMSNPTSLVYDGHHRTASEAEHHPDRLLPVWHSDNGKNFSPPPGSHR